jgi:hypothetical protein
LQVGVYKKLILCVFIFVLAFSTVCYSESLVTSIKDNQPQNPDIVGELFGVPVPVKNFYFAWGVVQVFGTRWRGVPKTTEEVEEQVWTEMLLSYETFRRNIEVSRDEIEEEIAKVLKSRKVSFDWKESPEDYAEWLQENIGAPVELFENQIEHLLKIEKLRNQVIDSIEPEVSEEEAIQEFLNEHNTLSVELIQFDELEEAEKFYQKAKNSPDFWEEKKEEKPDSFRRPGFVALEFLMHMWKFRKEDVYKMIELKKNEIYPPAPIYKGYGVFKILEIRRAVEENFPKYRESYYKQVKTQKKYKGFDQWLEDLKEEANIKIYLKSTEIFAEGS